MPGTYQPENCVRTADCTDEQWTAFTRGWTSISLQGNKGITYHLTPNTEKQIIFDAAGDTYPLFVVKSDETHPGIHQLNCSFERAFEEQQYQLKYRKWTAVWPDDTKRTTTETTAYLGHSSADLSGVIRENGPTSKRDKSFNERALFGPGSYYIYNTDVQKTLNGALYWSKTATDENTTSGTIILEIEKQQYIKKTSTHSQEAVTKKLPGITDQCFYVDESSVVNKHARIHALVIRQDCAETPTCDAITESLKVKGELKGTSSEYRALLANVMEDSCHFTYENIEIEKIIKQVNSREANMFMLGWLRTMENVRPRRRHISSASSCASSSASASVSSCASDGSTHNIPGKIGILAIMMAHSGKEYFLDYIEENHVEIIIDATEHIELFNSGTTNHHDYPITSTPQTTGDSSSSSASSGPTRISEELIKYLLNTLKKILIKTNVNINEEKLIDIYRIALEHDLDFTKVLITSHPNLLSRFIKDARDTHAQKKLNKELNIVFSGKEHSTHEFTADAQYIQYIKECTAECITELKNTVDLIIAPNVTARKNTFYLKYYEQHKGHRNALLEFERSKSTTGLKKYMRGWIISADTRTTTPQSLDSSSGEQNGTDGYLAIISLLIINYSEKSQKQIEREDFFDKVQNVMIHPETSQKKYQILISIFRHRDNVCIKLFNKLSDETKLLWLDSFLSADRANDENDETLLKVFISFCEHPDHYKRILERFPKLFTIIGSSEDHSRMLENILKYENMIKLLLKQENIKTLENLHQKGKLNPTNFHALLDASIKNEQPASHGYISIIKLLYLYAEINLQDAAGHISRLETEKYWKIQSIIDSCLSKTTTRCNSCTPASPSVASMPSSFTLMPSSAASMSSRDASTTDRPQKQNQYILYYLFALTMSNKLHNTHETKVAGSTPTNAPASLIHNNNIIDTPPKEQKQIFAKCLLLSLTVIMQDHQVISDYNFKDDKYVKFSDWLRISAHIGFLLAHDDMTKYEVQICLDILVYIQIQNGSTFSSVILNNLIWGKTFLICNLLIASDTFERHKTSLPLIAAMNTDPRLNIINEVINKLDKPGRVSTPEGAHALRAITHTDIEGNNFLHILMRKETLPEETKNTIKSLEPSLRVRLMQTRNNNGRTPLDILASNIKLAKTEGITSLIESLLSLKDAHYRKQVRLKPIILNCWAESCIYAVRSYNIHYLQHKPDYAKTTIDKLFSEKTEASKVLVEAILNPTEKPIRIIDIIAKHLLTIQTYNYLKATKSQHQVSIARLLSKFPRMLFDERLSTHEYPGKDKFLNGDFIFEQSPSPCLHFFLHIKREIEEIGINEKPLIDILKQTYTLITNLAGPNTKKHLEEKLVEEKLGKEDKNFLNHLLSIFKDYDLSDKNDELLNIIHTLLEKYYDISKDAFLSDRSCDSALDIFYIFAKKHPTHEGLQQLKSKLEKDFNMHKLSIFLEYISMQQPSTIESSYSLENEQAMTYDMLDLCQEEEELAGDTIEKHITALETEKDETEKYTDFLVWLSKNYPKIFERQQVLNKLFTIEDTDLLGVILHNIDPPSNADLIHIYDSLETIATIPVDSCDPGHSAKKRRTDGLSGHRVQAAFFTNKRPLCGSSEDNPAKRHCTKGQT